MTIIKEMMNNRYILAFPTAIILLMVWNEFHSVSATAGESEDTMLYKASRMPLIKFNYLPAKDTVYVLGDAYIELCLKTQKARLFVRDGDTIEFGISSGTSRISKGVDTPDGIYTVQNKSTKAISKQFNNAELFYWVGFNGNIGFHGLKGKGYYGYLGSRPSSHGCVRISCEDGEKIYGKVRRGTPIMAYYEEPARAMRFAKPAEYSPNKDFVLTSRNGRAAKQMRNRLMYLYTGKANVQNYSKIFMDGVTVFRPGGYLVGSADKIALKQELFIHESGITFVKRDKLSVSMNYRDDLSPIDSTLFQ